MWAHEHCLALVCGQPITVALAPAELKRARRRAKAYVWQGGVLHRLMPEGSTRICPPPADREQVVRVAHAQLGHFGSMRTAALVRIGHWWAGLTEDVRRHVACCPLCSKANVGGTARSESLNPLPIMGPFYRWGVDLCGPFPTTKRGYRYCFVAIEHFSKHVELVPIPDKRSDSTARAMLDIVARFGAPAEVLSDQGTEFQGAFEALLTQCFIDHRSTSAGHPQANGASERIVQVVKKGLRKRCEEQQLTDTWDEWLPWLALGYRCSPQQSTKFSPYYLLHGVQPVVPPAVHKEFTAPLNFENSAESVFRNMEIRAAAIKRATATAHHNLAIAQHRDTLRYSRTRSGAYRPRVLRFHPGDYVYTRRLNSNSTLQMPVHPEIYRVVSVETTGVAVVQGACGTRMAQHVQNLVPCHLENIDPRIDPRLQPAQLEVACEACQEAIDPEKLAGCDFCDRYYHIYCLQPELGRLPSSPWVCPACTTQGVTREQLGRRPAAAAPAPKARNLFPPAASRRRGSEVSNLQGRRVRMPFYKDAATEPSLYEGTVHMRKPSFAPYFYEVRFDDHTKYHYTVEGLAEGELLPEPAAAAAAVGAQAPARPLPLQWDLTGQEGVLLALQCLLPGQHSPRLAASMATCARSLAAAPGGTCGGASEAAPLLDMVDFSPSQLVLDPFACYGAVRQAFQQRRLEVLTNSPSALVPARMWFAFLHSTSR